MLFFVINLFYRMPCLLLFCCFSNVSLIVDKLFCRFLIIPDGNCMYRALAQALAHDQNQHSVLRKEVVNFIKENRVDFEVH